MIDELSDVELYELIKCQNEEAYNFLFFRYEHLSKLIIAPLITRFHFLNLDYDELKQESRIILDFIIRTFDYSKGNFFNYWYNERKFLTILKEHQLFHLFINRFNVLIQDASYPFLENYLKEKENKNEIKLFYNAFIVGGLSHVLQQWTETHFNINIDELINALSVFIPEH